MYSDRLLRGATQKQHVGEDGYPSASLFYFEQPPREDGYREESINWYPELKSLEILMGQQKDGKPQFKYGAALLQKRKLDAINRVFEALHRVGYEKREIPGNPYHGNLLLSGNVGKPAMRRIAGTLANAVDAVITREEARSMIEARKEPERFWQRVYRNAKQVLLNLIGA